VEWSGVEWPGLVGVVLVEEEELRWVIECDHRKAVFPRAVLCVYFIFRAFIEEREREIG
jgi:hypothetical protein